jgi:hypothetical protein
MKLSRRHVLRGAGVALALPWLESLSPRRATGQAASPRRFVPIYFPLGAGAYWRPAATGAGDAWQLSPILEPLAPLKRKVTVLSGVDATANGETVSSNALLTGAFLTCARCQSTPLSNGLSVDQRLATLVYRGDGLRSLQLGLSTLDSYTDGAAPAFSRSVSWASATEPLYKVVNPQAVFDQLVGATPTAVDPAALARRASRRSVLDFVKGSAASLGPRLGRSDGRRLDEFLTSVRGLESRIANDGAGWACAPLASRPALNVDRSLSQPQPGYDRDEHANVMMDLIVMALSCDAARVVSLMLDDARSEFAYNFLNERRFTQVASTAGATPVGSLHSHATSGDQNDGWATIDWWFASKVARLCQKMDAIPDADGKTLLDNSVVWFGSGQRNDRMGDNARGLPVLYVGSGGGQLRTDAHLDLGSTRLANVYLTFVSKVFGAADPAFGDSTGFIPDLLA